MKHLIQIDGEVRDMTADETAVLEEWRNRAKLDTAANEDIAAKRTSALAKLAALGLTEAEISALIGA